MNQFDPNAINAAMKNTLGETLGMQITECKKGRVVITMPVDHRHHQPAGLLHGGASVALAETAASLGGMLIVMNDGKMVVGQEINANHLRSVREGVVRAEADIIHQGRTSQVWEIKIFDESNDKLICISRCTLAVIEAK